jgi:hypothetical protein
MSRVLIKDIKWGSYKDFEGPYYFGKIKYNSGTTPSEEEKWLEVFTAAEGGHYDAVNMYDRCIISVGLVQWCEAGQFSVSDLLGHVAETCSIQTVHSALISSMISSNVTFKKTSKGKWRFVFLDQRGEVDTIEKQQQLFLGCTGKKGSWSPETQIKAKQWVSDMASLWIDPCTRKAQVNFTIPKLKSFFLPNAKKVLLDDQEDSNLAKVIRAAYLSFAGNNPTHANNALLELISEDLHEKWSYPWCVDLLKKLTFNANIDLYAGRYDKIRPVLERLWQGVILPKNAIMLKEWQPPRREVITNPEIASNMMHVSNITSQSDEMTLRRSSNTRQSNQHMMLESVVKAKHDELMHVEPTNSIGRIVGYIIKFMTFISSIFSRKHKK